MQQCPNCNFKSENSCDLFCAVCGSRLNTVPGKSVCEDCGADLRPHARFCTHCGRMLDFGPTLSIASGECTEICLSVTPGSTVPVRPANVERSDAVDRDTLPPYDPGWQYFFNEDRKLEKSHILSKEEIRMLGRQALLVIPERVAHYAPLVGVKYKRITIRNQKTVWGNCTYEIGFLSFNCLLMLMPLEALDAVVVHELCHMVHPNHSDEFYAEIHRVYPEYKKWDEWLDDHSSVLDCMEDGFQFRSFISY